MRLFKVFGLFVAFFKPENCLGVPSNVKPLLTVRSSGDVQPICGSTCVRRLFYKTAFASAATGLVEAMDAYQSYDWCINEHQDWCPSVINSTLSAIAGHTATTAALSVDVTNCDGLCLASSLSMISSKSALSAMIWADKTVNGSSSLKDARLEDQRNARIKDLRWTMWQLRNQARKPMQPDNKTLSSVMNCSCDDQSTEIAPTQPTQAFTQAEPEPTQPEPASTQPRPQSDDDDFDIDISFNGSTIVHEHADFNEHGSGNVDSSSHTHSDTVIHLEHPETVKRAVVSSDKKCMCNPRQDLSRLMQAPSLTSDSTTELASSQIPSATVPQQDRPTPNHEKPAKERDDDDDDDDDDHHALAIALPIIGAAGTMLPAFVIHGARCFDDPILCNRETILPYLKGVFKATKLLSSPFSWFGHLFDRSRSSQGSKSDHITESDDSSDFREWMREQERIYGPAPDAEPPEDWDPEDDDSMPPPPNRRILRHDGVFRSEVYNAKSGTLEQQTLVHLDWKMKDMNKGHPKFQQLIKAGYEPYIPLSKSGRPLRLNPDNPNQAPKIPLAINTNGEKIVWQRPEDLQPMKGDWRRTQHNKWYKEKYVLYEDGEPALSSMGEPLVRNENGVMETARASDSQSRTRFQDEVSYRLFDVDGFPEEGQDGRASMLSIEETGDGMSVNWDTSDPALPEDDFEDNDPGAPSPTMGGFDGAHDAPDPEPTQPTPLAAPGDAPATATHLQGNPGERPPSPTSPPTPSVGHNPASHRVSVFTEHDIIPTTFTKTFRIIEPVDSPIPEPTPDPWTGQQGDGFGGHYAGLPYKCSTFWLGRRPKECHVYYNQIANPAIAFHPCQLPLYWMLPPDFRPQPDPDTAILCPPPLAPGEIRRMHKEKIEIDRMAEW